MRIAITLAAALCVATVPVLRADDPVAPQAAAATVDYTADGRLPLGTIMGRFDALSAEHGWTSETIHDLSLIHI